MDDLAGGDMTVTADALGMIAGDAPRVRLPGDFHRHPTTGAPYVAHPTETNKDGTPRRVMYGRPSSFGAALDNPYNLLKWKERQLLIGASIIEPDWRPVDPDAREALDVLAAYCHAAAGSHLAADRGTHVHLLCEWCDDPARTPDMAKWQSLLTDGERLGTPRELQLRIIDQWDNFRIELGLTALAVEQTVVNDRWRLAGTLDRLDVSDRDHPTAFGVLEASVPFVGDIKTGGLTLGNDGQPNYWVKYPVQLAAYVDAVPYDTDTDERQEWWNLDAWEPDAPTRPNPDIALIYHYDLARALAGEIVDWQAIPVNVRAGREGGDICRAAADYGKRRDLFAMPAPKIAVPVPVPNPVTVEQPATDLEPVPRPVPGRAADPERLRNRISELVLHGHELAMRRAWPEGVPTLKHDGHTVEQLIQILDAVRKVEADVGARWHPDDAPEPRSRQAIERALKAWEGREEHAWFHASLIATFEQCRNPDATLEGLVGQFTIEQATRLYEQATQ
jgi:hypothetical protein